MYTPESLEMRAGLLSDPIVLQALDDLWQAANTDTTTDAEGEDFIDKVEYLEMHRCCSNPSPNPILNP